MLSSILTVLGVYKLYERHLRSQIETADSPKHVGIILDGNRRWARVRSYPRWIGHWFGAERAEQILDWCHDLGITTVTLYVLSAENLQRAPEELTELLALLKAKLQELLEDERIHRYHIRVKALGKTELLPAEIQALLAKIEQSTESYSDHFLNIAVAYGGRLEIVDVVRKLAERVRKGEIDPARIDQETIEENLYTSHLPNPEPDLIIRTSGEERLSGFLLWQSAYSELVVLDAYWPDFRKIDLMRAIRTYQKRARRFGK